MPKQLRPISAEPSGTVAGQLVGQSVTPLSFANGAIGSLNERYAKQDAEREKEEANAVTLADDLLYARAQAGVQRYISDESTRFETMPASEYKNEYNREAWSADFQQNVNSFISHLDPNRSETIGIISRAHASMNSQITQNYTKVRGFMDADYKQLIEDEQVDNVHVLRTTTNDFNKNRSSAGEWYRSNIKTIDDLGDATSLNGTPYLSESEKMLEKMNRTEKAFSFSVEAYLHDLDLDELKEFNSGFLGPNGDDASRVPFMRVENGIALEEGGRAMIKPSEVWGPDSNIKMQELIAAEFTRQNHVGSRTRKGGDPHTAMLEKHLIEQAKIKNTPQYVSVDSWLDGDTILYTDRNGGKFTGRILSMDSVESSMGLKLVFDTIARSMALGTMYVVSTGKKGKHGRQLVDVYHVDGEGNHSVYAKMAVEAGFATAQGPVMNTYNPDGVPLGVAEASRDLDSGASSYMMMARKEDDFNAWREKNVSDSKSQVNAYLLSEDKMPKFKGSDILHYKLLAYMQPKGYDEEGLKKAYSVYAKEWHRVNRLQAMNNFTMSANNREFDAFISGFDQKYGSSVSSDEVRKEILAMRDEFVAKLSGGGREYLEDAYPEMFKGLDINEAAILGDSLMDSMLPATHGIYPTRLQRQAIKTIKETNAPDGKAEGIVSLFAEVNRGDHSPKVKYQIAVGFAEELGDSSWAYYQDADIGAIAAKAQKGGFEAANKDNLGEERFVDYNTEINSLGENLREATPPGSPVDHFRKEVGALAGHYLVNNFSMSASDAVDKATSTLLGKNQFLVQVGGRAAIISAKTKQQYIIAGFLGSRPSLVTKWGEIPKEGGGANANALTGAIRKFNLDPRINERRLQRAGTTEEDDLKFQENRYWEIVEVSEGVVKVFFYEHSGDHEYESVMITQNINGIATAVPLSMDLQELYASYRIDQKYPEDALETSSDPTYLTSISPSFGSRPPLVTKWGEVPKSLGDIEIDNVDIGEPLKFPRGTNGSHLTSSIAESIYLAAGGDNGVKAMSMRVKGRDNGDGTVSSHLMASTGPDDPRGNYAFPTLFPKDPKNQTNNPEDWIELNEDEAFEEAKKRGELMKFDSFDEVDKFAQGSWKGGREWEKSMRPKQEFNKDNGFKVLVSTIVDGKLVYSNKFLAKRLSALEQSIITKEGLRLNDKGEHVAYKDSKGILTVGHGHRVLPEDDIVEGQVVSDDAVEALFAKDMSSVRKGGPRVTRNYNRLPLEAKDVIMQMIFQLGLTGTKGFTEMVKALNSNPPDLIEASKQMLLSEWATETPERAKKLSEAMKQASTYLRPLGVS